MFFIDVHPFLACSSLFCRSFLQVLDGFWAGSAPLSGLDSLRGGVSMPEVKKIPLSLIEQHGLTEQMKRERLCIGLSVVSTDLSYATRTCWTPVVAPEYGISGAKQVAFQGPPQAFEGFGDREAH